MSTNIRIQKNPVFGKSFLEKRATFLPFLLLLPSLLLTFRVKQL
ncbi:Hypothetical protein LDBND_1715 [Lactobacillus delbrueckii subsp. bulgaricus ND02]|nr:Hypothetical protein LDBND_1715 [Lactobacillus delbrueckii subsp. bulgaricus ND02]